MYLYRFYNIAYLCLRFLTKLRCFALFFQAGSDLNNFDHYRQLHNTEKPMQLKTVPKLTASHVNPGKLEKMNVRLATQVSCPNRIFYLFHCRVTHFPKRCSHTTYVEKMSFVYTYFSCSVGVSPLGSDSTGRTSSLDLKALKALKVSPCR